MKKNFKKNVFCNFAICGLQGKLNLFVFVLLIVMAAPFSFGQEFEMNNMPPPQIQLRYAPVSLESKPSLFVTVTIPERWHVNANISVDEFLKPSQVQAEARGIEFGQPKWPNPKKEYNEILDFENLIFEGTFQIEIPVEKVAPAADSLSTVVVFSYQACSNSICLAPNAVKADMHFSAPLSNLESANQQEVANQGKNVNQVNVGEKKVDERASEKLEKPEPSEKRNAESFAIEFVNVENSKSLPTESQQETNQNIEKPMAASEMSVAEMSKPAPSQSSTLLLLLFAFLGGALLNLMPCVLPVLSIKLFSLIKQSGESGKRLVLLGLSTVGGILVSFWVLASIVTILRLNGGMPGWGIQFQSAAFLSAITAVITLFAMSFLGAFEVFLPGSAMTKMDAATKKEGLLGAFCTGALLVLLSTPCSAPFLGSAMGFAFNETTPVLFLFFTVAALGLSLPYLILAVCPKLLRFLPKPGKWMNTLQKIMGACLLATVAWLVWVGNRSFGGNGFTFLILIAALNVIFAFGIGKLAPPYKPFYREVAAFIVVIILNGAVTVLALPLLQKAEAHAETGWVAYSETGLDSLCRNGKVVFLDITADWCLTCKANEAGVLSGDSVQAFFEKEGIVKMQADWTHASMEVRELLQSLGRSGVPVYAFYAPNQKPIVLSEILTPGAIYRAYEKIKLQIPEEI